MILSIRTDKPEAEIGLFDGQSKVDYLIWEAHRQLSGQIHLKIEAMLAKNKLSYQDLTGIIIFEGPGSFTGLRIGFSVANALAYGLEIPVAAAGGDGWSSKSINALNQNSGQIQALPSYGQLPKTTKPKK